MSIKLLCGGHRARQCVGIYGAEAEMCHPAEIFTVGGEGSFQVPTVKP